MAKENRVNWVFWRGRAHLSVILHLDNQSSPHKKTRKNIVIGIKALGGTTRASCGGAHNAKNPTLPRFRGTERKGVVMKKNSGRNAARVQSAEFKVLLMHDEFCIPVSSASALSPSL